MAPGAPWTPVGCPPIGLGVEGVGSNIARGHLANPNSRGTLFHWMRVG